MFCRNPKFSVSGRTPWTIVRRFDQILSALITHTQHEELRTLNRQLSNRVERARQDSVDSEKSSVHTPSVYASPDQSLKLPDHTLPHKQPDHIPPHKQPDHVPPHEEPDHVLPDSVPPREPPGRTTTERLNELSVRVAELEEMHIRDREEYEVSEAVCCVRLCVCCVKCSKTGFYFEVFKSFQFAFYSTTIHYLPFLPPSLPPPSPLPPSLPPPPPPSLPSSLLTLRPSIKPSRSWRSRTSVW